MSKPNPVANASIALVALAAFCWGLSGGIAAILMGKGWDAFVVAFYRGAIGLLFLFTWLMLNPRRSGLGSRRMWLWSAMAGLGIAGNFTFYFVSIAEGSIAVAAMLMYCAPVFVYLVSFTLKLEKPTGFKWVTIAAVMLGIMMLTQLYDIHAGKVTVMGAGAGLLAGLSYALFIFGFKYATPHGSPQAILTVAFAVVTLLLITVGDVNLTLSALTTPEWPLFIGLGILGAGLSFVFYVVGLKQTPPAVASIMAMVEPVTAALFGVAILKENLDIYQILGVGLILVAVTALSVRQTSGPGSADPEMD